MSVPNRSSAVRCPTSGSFRAPVSDAEAREIGMDKLEEIATGAVIYRYPIDRSEIVAGGGYRWLPWGAA